MKGRAELARLILAYAGIEFEDVRYERDEWLQHKPSKILKNLIKSPS